jgi:hypothetical protein
MIKNENQGFDLVSDDSLYHGVKMKDDRASACSKKECQDKRVQAAADFCVRVNYDISDLYQGVKYPFHW